MTEAKRKPWVWLAVAGLLVAASLAWFLLPVDLWIRTFIQWIESLGVWGVVAFGLVYILGTLLLAPAVPMSIAAGLAFGAWGIPIVLVAATMGAALAFLVARYWAHAKVRGLLEKRPRLKAVANAVREEGWKVVLLLRLSPLVPFELQNYFFGITDIPFRHYVLATFVGIIPGTIVYVYLGIIVRMGGGGSGGPLTWVFFGAGLLATIAVALLITRKVKAKLDQEGFGKSVRRAGMA
jgi:uncharacterized membrane protein YdjX (TVP38/TMEM64 family)